MAEIFAQLPAVPDHPALERDVLAWWESERIFDQLREQNRGGERFSFFDGPNTANNVDAWASITLWGRTLKDVFQRYKALRGFDQRYQNGFDCQGLWVEVKVEHDSRPELEARDRGVRPRRVRTQCRDLVAEFSRA